MEHGRIPPGEDVHSVLAFTYDDAAERLAATSLTSDDVGKIALQVDDSTYWILASVSPIAWSQLAGTTDERLPTEAVFTEVSTQVWFDGILRTEPHIQPPARNKAGGACVCTLPLATDCGIIGHAIRTTEGHLVRVPVVQAGT